MKLNEMKEEEFKTDIITLSTLGSIFSVKEYQIGRFYKEKLEQVKEVYGEREVEYFSYSGGIIVLEAED